MLFWGKGSIKEAASFTVKSNTTPPAANFSLFPCILFNSSSTVSQAWDNKQSRPQRRPSLRPLGDLS